ncbi:hypothetical protein ZEAMMB73_Zm00001d047889 [Zea mays]|uniref:Uncharacterized protein n=1 Tax=Zea mays TaxID=4577 RepID=A0A1D6PEE3_MAIZE|nr:hypothetical protein ZEAMMB73_Zm00001d047889 [Zea mays]
MGKEVRARQQNKSNEMIVINTVLIGGTEIILRYHHHSPLRMSVNSRSADVGRETLTFRSLINLMLVKIHRQLVQAVRSVGFSCS